MKDLVIERERLAQDLKRILAEYEAFTQETLQLAAQRRYQKVEVKK